MTREEKQMAIAELKAVKKMPVTRCNIRTWLQIVAAKFRVYFPNTNHTDEIAKLFDPWTSTDADVKDKQRMTFKQAVDSAKGTIAQIVSQLHTEVELHIDEDTTGKLGAP